MDRLRQALDRFVQERRFKEPPVCEEWVQVTSWGGRDLGWIPRRVLEGMGIDCSPLDRRETWMGREHQGTVWFDSRQAEAIRSHREFESEVS